MIFKNGDIYEGYKLEEEIGRGGTAIVWSVTDESSKYDKALALKMFTPDIVLHQESVNEIKGQFYKQKGIMHPSILPPLELLDIDGVPAVLFEKADRSLYNHLKVKRRNNARAGFSEEFIVDVLLDIAEGLEYLHNMDLAHNDVKTDNVLVFDKGGNRYRLCDLDTSVTLRATIMRLTTKSNEKSDIHFTPLYVAPEKKEAIGRGGYAFFDAKKSDIFSLGVMALELCTQISVPPEQMLDDGTLTSTINNLTSLIGESHSQELKYTPRFKCLLFCLLERDQQDRLSLQHLIEQLRYRKLNGHWDQSLESRCREEKILPPPPPPPTPWFKYLIGLMILGASSWGAYNFILSTPEPAQDYTKIYDSVSTVVNGYACVCNQNQCGVIDFSSGTLETALEYSYCRISDNTIRLIKNDEEIILEINDNQLKKLKQ